METLSKNTLKNSTKKAKTQSTNKNQSFEIGVPIPIENLPFAIVKRAKDDYVIIFGKWLIDNNSHSTFDKAMEFLQKPTWNSILNVIGIIIENSKNNSNE